MSKRDERGLVPKFYTFFSWVRMGPNSVFVLESPRVKTNSGLKIFQG